MKSKQIYSACIYCSFFVIAMVNAMPGIMLTSFIDQYALLSSAQGAPGAALSFGQALALIFLFWQAGRISKSVIVTFSFAVIVVLLFTISVIPPYTVLVLLFCLLGTVFGAISSTASSLIADLYTGAGTSKYMSRLHGIFGLGGLVTPIIFMRLFTAGLHWNIAVRIVTAMIAVLLIIYLVFTGYSLKSVDLPKSSNLKIKLEDFKRFFKRGTNALLIFSMFFYAAHQSVIAVWIIRYVSVFLGDISLGALSLSLFWGGITVSRLFTHKLLPVSPVKIVLCGNLVSTIVLLAGVFSGSAIVMAACVFIVGLLNGTSIPVLLATGCADNDGNTILPTSLLNLSMFVALVACPLVVGALVEYTTMRSGLFLSAFCTLASGVFVFTYVRKKRQ